MEKTENIALKLGIVGNTAVGKTTLILRVAEGKFYDNTSAGIALDFRTIRNYEVNKKLYNLLIYDIAG
jgi:GTPase SAR1 family protein